MPNRSQLLSINRDWLTDEQMARVWSALEMLGETKQRDTALVHILAHGLRAGEIVKLNVGSFDGKLLFLPDTKTNEPRLVPLRKESRDVLQEYLRSRSIQGKELTSLSPLMISHHASYQGDRCLLPRDRRGAIKGVLGKNERETNLLSLKL